MKPKAAQYPVQDKCDARHVAAILQNGDQRKEDEEDRNVVEERVQVVDDPQHELPQQGQLDDSGLGKDALGEAAEPGEDGPRVVGEVVALYEGKIVESVDDEKKEDGAEEPVADQPVYALGDMDLLRVLSGHAALGDGRGPSAALAGDVEVGAHAPLVLERLPQGLRPGQDVLGHVPSLFAHQGRDLRVALHQFDGDPRKREGPLKGRLAGRKRIGQQQLQLLQGTLQVGIELGHGDARPRIRPGHIGDRPEKLLTPTPMGDSRRDDGDAQLPREPRNVHGDIEALGHIHHVEVEDEGNLHLQELERQVQAALEVGGVHDVDDRRQGLLQEHVAGDALLGRVGCQAVGSGEVDDLHGLAVALVPAHHLIDGHAGIVGHKLPCARQAVEDGRFAAVWLARQGYDLFFHSGLFPFRIFRHIFRTFSPSRNGLPPDAG